MSSTICSNLDQSKNLSSGNELKKEKNLRDDIFRLQRKELLVCVSSYTLNPFPNKPWFLHVCSTSLLKTLGKREIARNKLFLLFPLCFLFI